MLDMIAKHKLTNRKYKEMKSLINMIYDYAIENEIVQTNTALQRSGNFIQEICQKKKRSLLNSRSILEMKNSKSSNQPWNSIRKLKIRHISVCVSTLHQLSEQANQLHYIRTNLTDDTITISKQEIKTYEKVNEKRHRNGYEIVINVKSQTSERELFLTSLAQDFIQMIIEANEQRGFKKATCFQIQTENGCTTMQSAMFYAD